MDGLWRYSAKWNKSDVEIQIPYDFTSRWNLKKNKERNKQTELKQNKLIDTENRLMVQKKKGFGGEWNWWKGQLYGDVW